MSKMRESDSRYKDAVRHGGKRSELISTFGLRCSACGVSGSGYNIVAHHLTGNSQDHHLQVLLCRKCHAKLHQDGVDKKQVRKDEIIAAMKTASSLDEAAKIIGISRAMLRQRRRRYGLMNKPCDACGREFTPTPSLKNYCSEGCAINGKKSKYEKRAPNREKQKSINDRKYRESHKEELAESKRKYYFEHAEAIKARTREWYKRRKESVS